MSNKILNKVNNDIFSYDSTGGVFKMSRVMPTEIHHVTGGAGTSGYILTSTGNGWSWTDPATLSSGSMSLISLTDTSLSNPQNGDILEYDSTTQLWKNVTPSGGSGGTTVVQNNTALVSNLPQTYAGPSCITLGYLANYSNTQSANSVAIGMYAQGSGSAEGAISIGHQSGGQINYAPAPLRSVAIGFQAGRGGHGTDGTDSIDIGYFAGGHSTTENCISIGFLAGNNTQGVNAIAMGYSAGQIHQGDNSIAIGYKASRINQSPHVDRYIVLNAQTIELNPDNNDAFYVKPIRPSANDNKLLYNSDTGEITYQPDSSSAYNLSGLTDTSLSNPQNGDILEYDSTTQMWKNVAPSGGSGGTTIVQNNSALVSNLPYTYAGPSCITLGVFANVNNLQSPNSIAIGTSAQYSGSAEGAISIGNRSGGTPSYGAAPLRSISIGWEAGRGYAGTDSIDIGSFAGTQSYSDYCINIGRLAGNNTQGVNAIAIGYEAGQIWQGDNSIAIGYKASRYNQANVDRYIVLTAQTTELNPDNNDAFYVKPIRSSTNDNKLLYNATTGEITYQPESPSAGVSNPKVYGSIWCDADYVITTYTLWGGENANPISTNAGWGAGYDFVNSHPNMWINPDPNNEFYWMGKTGNVNVLLIPRDGHYHITIHQLVYNSVWDSHTITSLDMWIGRFRPQEYWPAGWDRWNNQVDPIGGFFWASSAANHGIHVRATATVFCRAGDRIFGQFGGYTSTGGTIVGDAGNPSGMSDGYDGYVEGHRRSGFSVFSID